MFALSVTSSENATDHLRTGSLCTTPKNCVASEGRKEGKKGRQDGSGNAQCVEVLCTCKYAGVTVGVCGSSWRKGRCSITSVLLNQLTLSRRETQGGKVEEVGSTFEVTPVCHLAPVLCTCGSDARAGVATRSALKWRDCRCVRGSFWRKGCAAQSRVS